MKLRLHTLVAAPLALLIGAGPLLATPPSLEARIEGYRRQAAKLAAAGKLDAAIGKIGEARGEVDQALKRVGPGRAPRDPRETRELKALQKWLNGQVRLANGDKARLAESLRTYRTRRAAIVKKYRSVGAQQAQARREKQAQAARARLLLMRASLDETLATYFTKRGKADQAQALRRKAALGRLEASRMAGKPGDAAAAADKLLAAAGNDAEAYRHAGELYQEQRRFDRAAGVWQHGIRLLESGSADPRLPGTSAEKARQRRRLLETFYRQLAFCYEQLGKTAEMNQAMEKANELADAKR